VEAVEASDLQANIIDTLMNLYVPHLYLRTGHLQGDKTLLGLVLDICDTMLHTSTASVDILPEASLHTLELIQHQPEVGIHRILGPLAVGVVVGIGLHIIE
jgi:hypothetical protein